MCAKENSSAVSFMDATGYDSSFKYVSEFGAELLQLLRPQENERVLDIGCGTGDLTKMIADSGADVMGIDNSAAMIAQARCKFPDITFVEANAVTYQTKTPFDAVFSNATIHWIKESDKLLVNILNLLRPDGRFIAEFGARNNVRLITDGIIKALQNSGYPFEVKNFPWFFPELYQYVSMMENAGLTVVYASYFDRPTKLAGAAGLRNWIKMFAGSFFQGIPESEHEEILCNIEDSLKKDLFRDGFWNIDYKRLRVKGIKTERNECY